MGIMTTKRHETCKNGERTRRLDAGSEVLFDLAISKYCTGERISRWNGRGIEGRSFELITPRG